MKKLITALVGAAFAASLLPGLILAQEIPTALKQGMTYAQARKLLLDAGWQAVELSPNRQRFGAMNYIIDQLGYNEVVTCSDTGRGYCRFNFSDANGRTLAVVTISNSQQPKLNRWWIVTKAHQGF